MTIVQIIKYNSVFYVLVTFLFLSFTGYAQSPNAKGKYTKKIKEPKIGHFANELIGVKVKRIRGKLILDGNDVPQRINYFDL